MWTNNALVAAESLIFGILLGLPTLLVLYQNSANIGVAGALMIAHGKGVLFFALIMPHGILELSAVFLAAATGLLITKTVQNPAVAGGWLGRLAKAASTALSVWRLFARKEPRE